MRIKTIEDGYQYRVNEILHKFAKAHSYESEFKDDAESAAWKYRKELGEWFVDDISQYCGVQEAWDEED